MKPHDIHQQINRNAVKICMPVLTLMIAAFSSSLLAQQQTAFFINYQNNPLQNYTVPSNRESHPFFIDIDGDGDLDCFSGEYTNSLASKIYYYRNDGTSTRPIFKAIKGNENPLDGVDANSLSIPYFVDIDGDGDYDCFIGEGNTGAILYYKNIGSATHPVFQKESAAFNPLSMAKFSTSMIANPAFADIDGDGDYDCLVVDESGNLNFFKNTGTVKDPAFVHVDEDNSPFKFLSSLEGIYNVSFEDWNKDGLVDLFINTTYYKNIGTKLRPRFRVSTDDEPLLKNTSVDKFTYTPLRWVDLNNDGNVEVVQGNSKGGFDYQTLSIANAPVINPAISAHVSPNPSKYDFTLNLSSTIPSIIRVIDVQGKVLATQITSSQIVKFGTELKPGVYIVQVMQNNKVVYNQKIIKE